VLGVEVAPVGDGHRRLGGLRLLHALAVRRVSVNVERAAGGVDDHDAVVAGGGDDLVHLRHHDADALGGAFTIMIVPHVANDDDGLGGFPVHGALDHFNFTAAGGFLAPLLEFQPQLAGNLRAVGDKFVRLVAGGGGGEQASDQNSG